MTEEYDEKTVKSKQKNQAHGKKIIDSRVDDITETDKKYIHTQTFRKD